MRFTVDFGKWIGVGFTVERDWRGVTLLLPFIQFGFDWKLPDD